MEICRQLWFLGVLSIDNVEIRHAADIQLQYEHSQVTERGVSWLSTGISELSNESSSDVIPGAVSTNGVETRLRSRCSRIYDVRHSLFEFLFSVTLREGPVCSKELYELIGGRIVLYRIQIEINPPTLGIPFCVLAVNEDRGFHATKG